MKKIIILAFALVLALSLAACGNGSKDNGGEIARGKSATVKDGIIGLEGAALDFGTNPVGGGETLTVLKPTEEQMPLGMCGEMYELAFDAAPAEPVAVSIPVGDLTLRDDESFMLGIGVDFSYDDGTVYTNYSYVPAEVKDGLLTASFVPDDYGEFYAKSSSPIAERTERPYDSVKFTGIKFREATSAHFQLHYSDIGRNHGNTAKELLDHLEDAYDYFQKKGYGDGEGYFPKRKSLAWPMDVYVESLIGYSYGKYVEGGDPDLAVFTHDNSGIKHALVTDNWALGSIIKIHYDTFYKKETKQFRALMFHEFFHFVQSNFIPRFMQTTRWFDDAAAAYYEWEAGGTVPNNVQGRYYHLFDGIKPADDKPASAYVRCILLKYLVDDVKGGDDSFLAELTKSPPEDWFEALMSKTGQNASAMTFSFFDKLVSDKYDIFKPNVVWRTLSTGESIYGSYAMLTDDRAKLGLLLPLKYDKETARACTEKDEPVVLGDETVRIPVYGAKCIGFNADNVVVDDLPDGVDPVVTVSGGEYQAIIYLISGGDSQRLTVGTSDTVVLTNFKENLKANKRYMVLFVNPGTDTGSDIDSIVAGVKVEMPDDDDIEGTYDGKFVVHDEKYDATIDVKWKNQAENECEIRIKSYIISGYSLVGKISKQPDGSYHYESERTWNQDGYDYYTITTYVVDIVDKTLTGTITEKSIWKEGGGSANADTVNTFTATKQ